MSLSAPCFLSLPASNPSVVLFLCPQSVSQTLSTPSAPLVWVLTRVALPKLAPPQSLSPANGKKGLQEVNSNDVISRFKSPNGFFAPKIKSNSTCLIRYGHFSLIYYHSSPQPQHFRDTSLFVSWTGYFSP